ncbi:uncharacterized protein G2W53_018191 [Senna tora]|uniref:Uncharacterized protein n=1 Tax=Senna tora TaxID=362788 RepID=A0A834TS70_9FABA|nr:uncharacterized protein G2W53_018191 [Senna tora]
MPHEGLKFSVVLTFISIEKVAEERQEEMRSTMCMGKLKRESILGRKGHERESKALWMFDVGGKILEIEGNGVIVDPCGRNKRGKGGVTETKRFKAEGLVAYDKIGPRHEENGAVVRAIPRKMHYFAIRE